MATGKKAQPWEKLYDLCEDLGEGGNASVFRVREKSTGKEFALKQLVQKSTEKKARFISEIQIVKKYVDKIDGILPIYEYSEDEFLEGVRGVLTYWIVLSFAVNDSTLSA